MIRKLTEKDREGSLDFLKAEPSINLFIIGDIENFGFDKDFQELWGSFDEDDKIDGVLLRYHENFIVYHNKEDFDNSHFKKIISSFKGNTFISGKQSIIQNFVDLKPEGDVRNMYFCELTNNKQLITNGDTKIEIAKEHDAIRMYNLMEKIDEFDISFPPERTADNIKNKSSRAYYIENEAGVMISVSQTTAENSISAMIVGVATAKGYRKKGLMSQCLSKLCEDVLAEGKSLCLFYDNEKAGRVYHKMGFVSVDKWTMIK